MNYFNIPSTSAITRKQAIKEAKGRNWSADDYQGLSFQGDHGETIYIKFSELTSSEKEQLKNQL